VTDDTELSFCQIIINQSGSDDLEIINISLEGLASGECSNSSEVTVGPGSVINYTIRVNDSSGTLSSVTLMIVSLVRKLLLLSLTLIV